MRGLLMLVATVATLWACGDAYGRTSFMPENSLWMSDDIHSFTGIDETTFNKVIDKVYSIYAPIISKLGGTLVIERNWRDSTINAYTSREGNTWIVAMFGGLARHSTMNEGGFALVLCHEISHNTAGFRLYEGDPWAASESQSDQVGAQVCLQKYFANITSNVATLSKVATDKCKAVYSGQALRECYHRLSASKSCADLLGTLNGETAKFETYDKTVVKETIDSHMNAQCRLDSYVIGTLCTKKWDDAVIPDAYNQAQYNCERSRCWYAP